MNSNNPNNFWRFLRHAANEAPNENIEFESLYNFFKEEANNQDEHNYFDREFMINIQNHIENNSNFFDDVLSVEIDEVLNQVITENELRHSLRTLKNGKAPGVDGICNEFLNMQNRT
mgnify:CR=1 FL=1